ncbi:hypothetical protein [Clavibacter sp. km3a]|uniref:hypothetical protein n=1 Tax=Clavibacter sp. km3a TaxID=3459135 RepID=UPI0040415E42
MSEEGQKQLAVVGALSVATEVLLCRPDDDAGDEAASGKHTAQGEADQDTTPVDDGILIK